jgi:hypothetical protein
MRHLATYNVPSTLCELSSRAAPLSRHRTNTAATC